jgi:3-methyladenine DNA glycosylase/8-oxoguanine DNA glycosylase
MNERHVLALLIALRREDVVLPGDLALRKAVKAAYQEKEFELSERTVVLRQRQR